MIDRRKIIVMSKLAVYDKKMGQADRKVDRLFRRDFIYRQNMWTRLYAAVTVIVLLACYWVYRFFSTDMDLFTLDYEAILTQSTLILGAVLLFFTVVGTIKATIEYQNAQARLTRYYKLLNHLDRMSARNESGEASNEGRDFAGKRNNH